MFKQAYLFLFLQLASVFATAQIQVKGKIMSQENNPVAGASVTAKLKGTHTTTNRDGYFSITVTGNDTLMVTHISYKTEQIPLPQNLTALLLVTLEKADKELDEVIVSTGLQKLPKERATGSFTFIDNKLFNEQVGTNVIDRLKYIANGFSAVPSRNTGNTTLLTVRGLSTLTAAIAKPLLIVDNFEYQGDIGNINPNDIADITFLKDAAAGSIWGAKAANGVIVITTRKGSFNRPTKVEVNSNITFAEKPDLLYSKNIAAADFIDLEQFLFNKGFYASTLLLPQYYPLSPVVNLLDKAKRGLLPQQEADRQINAMRNNDIRNEYSRHFYRQAVNRQYALSVSGGSKNIGWLLSAGIDKNTDELHATYNRFNVRIENVYAPLKNLEITTSAYYTQTRAVAGRPAFGSIATQRGALPPYTSFADANGNPLPVFTHYNAGYIDTAGGGKLLNWNYYPLEDYKSHKNQTQVENLNTVLALRYKINKQLNVDVKYRYQQQQGETEYIRTQGSFFTRNLVNMFTQIVNGSLVYKIPKGDILDLAQNTTTAQNLRAQLNYSQKWNKQELTVLAGTDVSETRTKSNAYRTYGYNADILTYGTVDFTNPYPQYPFGSNAFIPNSFSFGKRNDRFVSTFANAAYTYTSRYTVSVSARRDASNSFGVNTNDRWKPLWSAGLGWNISKESFYKNRFIPYLRLKTTFGYQGNIDPSKVAATTVRYSGTNTLTQTPFAVISNYYNPDLKWEQVGMLNTSLEWATVNNRLSGSFEYYQKRMTDLYASMPIESTMGVGATMLRNAGSMKGQGWDIELNSININGKFQWLTNFIFNTYTDKITKAKNPATLVGADVVGGTTIGSPLEGYSPFVYFAYPWAGLDPATGDPLGYINGQPSKDYAAITYQGTKFSDVRYIGSLSPRIFGSIGNAFSWKGVSLSVRITYRFKYYFRRESVNYYSLINQAVGHSDYALRWQKTGDEKFTTVPSFVYPVDASRDDFYQMSEVLATRADHIRLQYINLSYELKNVLKKIPVSQASVYVVGNNIGLLWKANRLGIDPEYSNNSIPPARSIAVGLRVSF